MLIEDSNAFFFSCAWSRELPISSGENLFRKQNQTRRLRVFVTGFADARVPPKHWGTERKIPPTVLPQMASKWRTHEQRQRQILGQLERMFGSEARSPLSFSLHRWGEQPLTSGNGGAAGGGHNSMGDAALRKPFVSCAILRRPPVFVRSYSCNEYQTSLCLKIYVLSPFPFWMASTLYVFLPDGVLYLVTTGWILTRAYVRTQSIDQS